jgi:hypothetical protein
MDRSARRPILVTGVPRSGTTWLARWLASGRRMSLPGREPMNPRGRNYALGGTLPGWARLTDPTPRQRRALRTSYQGVNPLVYSRYGYRQTAALLPGTRLVIKDPFALLSIPTVVRVTGAVPVLVYRHPGAVLASYRRMGWTQDRDEVQALVEASREAGGPRLDDLPEDADVSPAEAMGHFWARLHDLALGDVDAAGMDVVVVAHQELAVSGPSGGRRLADALGVVWTEDMERELAKEATVSEGSPTELHNFDRAPALVAEQWRSKLREDEIADVERVTEETRQRLAARRIRLQE